ncbi:hypothetical protein ABY45_02880 [Microbacterium maritypicum]|uniref:hypothetical protein n=1 Tax=Microbacterium maritypicum TaxID=33918 RepID=UPI003D6EC437
MAVLFLAAAGLVELGLALSADIALFVAVVPLALGVTFAVLLPRSVRDGRPVFLRALLDDTTSAP